jgi:hypothetical protein
VDSPRREVGDVDPTVRDLVRLMQRRAFEVTAGWNDIDERKLGPAALDRLAEIRVPPWFWWARSISRRSTRRPGAWPTELLTHASSTGHTPPSCHRWNVPTTSSPYSVPGWPCPSRRATETDDMQQHGCSHGAFTRNSADCLKRGSPSAHGCRCRGAGRGSACGPARAIDAGLPDSIRALRQQDEADAGDALS